MLTATMPNGIPVAQQSGTASSSGHAPSTTTKENTVMCNKKNQKGFTLIELLIVVAIIGIIAAIAVPGLLRARISGNEASAIGSMRAINTAMQNYSQMCNGYAKDLQELKTAANSLPPALPGAAPVVKSAYTALVAKAAAGQNVPSPPAGCT